MKKGVFRLKLRWIFVAVISVLLIFALSYKHIMKTLYPLKYSSIVLKYSEEYDIDPDLIFAVIKSESGFNPNAHSDAGARGLMQITEETFEWINSMEEIQGKYTFDSMFEPEVSVKYGCVLLKLYLSEFSDISAVLSAYHAGYNITLKWLKDKSYSPDGITLQHIPFEDTAGYVNKVTKTIKIYESLYGGNYES